MEATAKRDVCQSEDAVFLFLEYLIDPKLLPNSYVKATPSQSDQELVAKQVYAVVLLYNYFYRKQCPELEFMIFEDFCKLAVILRPGLLRHVKFLLKPDDCELEDLEKDLSLMEKSIVHACDVCKSLDASKDAPNIKGWPIMTVSVLLVDSKRKNCFLQLGSVTSRVWSVIEVGVSFSSSNSGSTDISENVDRRKRFLRKPLTRDGSSIDEAALCRLAFSSVKELTGIHDNNLVVLSRGITYSLSREKAVSQFYIIQCLQHDKDDVKWIPIEDVIDSLSCPLLVQSSSQWMCGSVIEYFHLLPYAGILFDWFSSVQA